MQEILAYLVDGLVLTVQQLLMLLGPGLLLAWCMHLVSQDQRLQAARLLGVRPYIYLTAIGTVVHEMSHALFCLMFGHRIVELKLFQPGTDGTLGYVAHTCNPRNPWHRIGNFFIGTGPLWVGTLVIWLLARGLLGREVLAPLGDIGLSYRDFTSLSGLIALAQESASALLGVLGALSSGGLFSHWSFYIFLYLVFAIGGHVTLSAPDLAHSAAGFWIMAGLLLAINWATMWTGSWLLDACLALTRYMVVFYAMMIFALALNLGFALILRTINLAAR